MMVWARFGGRGLFLRIRGCVVRILWYVGNEYLDWDSGNDWVDGMVVFGLKLWMYVIVEAEILC